VSCAKFKLSVIFEELRFGLSFFDKLHPFMGLIAYAIKCCPIGQDKEIFMNIRE
jgi:hypothetical protein